MSEEICSFCFAGFAAEGDAAAVCFICGKRRAIEPLDDDTPLPKGQTDE